MRVSMILLIVLVVFTSLATAKPFFQSNRRCRGGTSWPEGECNTCTCRSDGKSYACTTSSCKSPNSLHSRIDEAEGLVQPNNNQEGLQALDALTGSNSDHGEWLPFDITQYMASFN